MKIGPLSVALDASLLQFYHRGVFNPPFCDPKSLDHGESFIMKTFDCFNSGLFNEWRLVYSYIHCNISSSYAYPRKELFFAKWIPGKCVKHISVWRDTASPILGISLEGSLTLTSLHGYVVRGSSNAVVLWWAARKLTTITKISVNPRSDEKTKWIVLWLAGKVSTLSLSCRFIISCSKKPFWNDKVCSWRKVWRLSSH